RIESGYSDNRHPDSVEFTGNLRDDLSRRDFTVNAMCYNEEYGLTDAFGGLDDLSGRLIRAVGDPELRFSEDALRILRAIRFSSVLGFEIEEKTAEAAVKKRELLRGVSVERIFTELKKLLMGKGAASVIEKYESILTVFLPELKGISVRMKDHPHLFSGMDATSAFVTLFAIDHEITEKGYRLAAERLKTDNYVRNTGAEIVKYLRVAVTETDTDLLKLLSVTGYDVADRILEIRLALGIDKEDKRKVLERIEKTRPYKISHLNINGNDLMEQGIRGSRIGDALSRLLNAVINGEVSNTKEELKRFVNKLYR
ncbi:MAG: CCA tRNA nucleotidyltransferase, partial [Clostridia bacterium]|nr:CCA tRNA nucleotidyltransferase [Clostridia bacterium]